MNYIKLYANPDGTMRRDLQVEVPIFQYSTNNALRFISPINPLDHVVYAVIELANKIVLPAKLMILNLEQETIDNTTWYVWEWPLSSAATSAVLKNKSSPLWVSFYFEKYDTLNALISTQTTEKTELVVNPTNMSNVTPLDDDTAQIIRLQLNDTTLIAANAKSKNIEQDAELHEHESRIESLEDKDLVKQETITEHGVELEEHEVRIETLEGKTEETANVWKGYIEKGDTNLEVINARGTFAKLADRLKDNDNKVAIKTDKTYVDQLAQSLASGSPKGTYATVEALQLAYPNGNNNIYVVTADGKWYYWNGISWTAGGVYQSTGLANKSIINNKLNLPINLLPKTFEFIVGNLSGGIVVDSNNRCVTSDIIFVKKGTTVKIKDPINTKFAINLYNDDFTHKGNAGFTNGEQYVFTVDSIVRFIQGYANDKLLTQNDLDYFGNNLFLLDEDTVLSSKEIGNKIKEEIFENVGNSLSGNSDYDSLLLNSQFVNPLTLKKGMNLLVGTYLQESYNLIDYNNKDILYAVVKTTDYSNDLSNQICIRQGIPGNGNAYRTNSVNLGKGLYFVKHSYVYGENYNTLQFFLDNRTGVTNIEATELYVSLNGLYSNNINKLLSSNSIFYVAPDGDNKNDGLTPQTSLATFSKAIGLGAKVIYAKRGKYYNQTIIKTGGANDTLRILPYEDNIYNIDKPDRPLIEIINGVKLDNLVSSSGLLTQSFVGNTRFNQVFISKTLNPSTGGTRPSYNAGVWQIHSDIKHDNKLKPVLTYSECIAEQGTFYWDGVMIYINPFSTFYTHFIVQNDANDLLHLSNFNEVELHDMSFQFAINRNVRIINCMNTKLHNCESKYTLLLDGFQFDKSNGNFYNCKSYKANNDGFNIHEYGVTNFYDCIGGYNYDDGISHHDGCVGSINGGEWFNNGKAGIAPTYGAIIDVYNTINHDNIYGIYCLAQNTQPYRTVRHIGNVCYNNTVGITLSYIKILSFNCKYENNLTPVTVSNGELIIL